MKAKTTTTITIKITNRMVFSVPVGDNVIKPGETAEFTFDAIPENIKSACLQGYIYYSEVIPTPDSTSESTSSESSDNMVNNSNEGDEINA